jgi:leader peptidase (prepilin peptidase)/N-methyltransferase
MSPIWIALTLILGFAAGPWQRARIFHHAHPFEEPRRDHCPHCDALLVGPGRRGVTAILPSSGRCPNCRTHLGPPAFAVELVTAVVFGLLAWHIAQPAVLAALCWLALIGTPLAFIDIAVHRLPDRLTLAAIAGTAPLLVIAAFVVGQPHRIASAAVAGIGMAIGYLVLAVVANMGLGDAKLAFPLGAAMGYFGLATVLVGAAAGFLLGGVQAATLLVLRKANRKSALPHGPVMLLGALAAILATIQ